MNPDASIPGGVWRNGLRNRDVRFRELSASDQLVLTTGAQGMLPGAWATELLSRCIESLGGEEQVTKETVSSLCAGDREALLLEFRRRFMGDSLQCTLTCPLPDCGEKLDLELRIPDLLVPGYPEWLEIQEAQVDGYAVRFRLPSGADQEFAGPFDPRLAAALLLLRCVESVRRSDGSEACEWPVAMRSELPAMMARLDPQAELQLEVRCTVCGGSFSTVLDTAAFLKRELPDHFRRLFSEVHQLAYHYHWSASEILGMPRETRSLYLQMLERQLAAGVRRDERFPL